MRSVICLENCPQESDYTAFICRYDLQDSVDSESLATQFTYVNDYQCMYQIKTRRLVNRCFPDMDTLIAFNDAAETAAGVGVTLDSFAVYSTAKYAQNNWLSDFFGDLFEARSYIFGFGLGFSVLVAFIYLYLLRIPYLLFTIIWSIILSVQVMMIVGSFLLWSLANTWRDDDIHTKNETTTMYTFAYIGMGVSALYFCTMVVLRRRIQLAIFVVKEAAKALGSMPSLLALPAVQALGLAIFLVPWMIYLVYLASSGDIVVHENTFLDTSGQELTYRYRTFNYTKSSRYAFLYFIFCYFWTSEFLIAIGQLTIALSFSAWYFSRKKSTVGTTTVTWVRCSL